MAAAFFALSAMLTSCDGNGMKGSKFVNGDVKHDPMNFSTTETVGVVYFADDCSFPTPSTQIKQRVQSVSAASFGFPANMRRRGTR